MLPSNLDRICCGLVLGMPGSEVGEPRFESLLDPHQQFAPVAIQVCSIVRTVYGTFATERPLETISKEKKFPPGSRVINFCDITEDVESDVKT